MGKGMDELRRIIERRLNEAGAVSFYAVVESVDEQHRTCSVSSEGVTYEQVLLYAVEKAALKGFCLIPTVKSTVVVARVAGGSHLYVELFSEVSKVLLTVADKVAASVDEKGCLATVGKSTLKMTEQGFTLSRDGAGLKKTLEALLEALTKLTVTTGVGPSGVPINAADFVKIKQELTKYMEG
jgi:hypothetical protein